MDNNFEIDNSIEQFMTLFNKMFSETKYNLQALNKRMESMDKCFNNVMLLKTDKPFDEEKEEQEKETSNNNKTFKGTDKNSNLKMTSKELDAIEKMFKEIDEPTKTLSNKYLNKKRTNKKSTANDGKEYYQDIEELLKTYPMIDESNNETKNKRKTNNSKTKNKINNTKIEEYILSSDNSIDIDYHVPEKKDEYTKFKEIKKKIQKKKKIHSSDEDEIDDDLDFDL